jgi:hypothetical protein
MSEETWTQREARERAERETWLASLKPGDPVWTQSGETTVEKVTRANGGTIIAAHGDRFAVAGYRAGWKRGGYGYRLMTRAEYEEHAARERADSMRAAAERIAYNPYGVLAFLDVCEYYHYGHGFEVNGARVALNRIIAAHGREKGKP